MPGKKITLIEDFFSLLLSFLYLILLFILVFGSFIAVFSNLQSEELVYFLKNPSIQSFYNFLISPTTIYFIVIGSVNYFLILPRILDTDQNLNDKN